MKSFPLVVHQQDVLRETQRKNRVVDLLFFLQERRMMKRAEQQRSEYPRWSPRKKKRKIAFHKTDQPTFPTGHQITQPRKRTASSLRFDTLYLSLSGLPIYNKKGNNLEEPISLLLSPKVGMNFSASRVFLAPGDNPTRETLTAENIRNFLPNCFYIHQGAAAGIRRTKYIYIKINS